MTKNIVKKMLVVSIIPAMLAGCAPNKDSSSASTSTTSASKNSSSEESAEPEATEETSDAQSEDELDDQVADESDERERLWNRTDEEVKADDDKWIVNDQLVGNTFPLGQKKLYSDCGGIIKSNSYVQTSEDEHLLVPLMESRYQEVLDDYHKPILRSETMLYVTKPDGKTPKLRTIAYGEDYSEDYNEVYPSDIYRTGVDLTMMESSDINDNENDLELFAGQAYPNELATEGTVYDNAVNSEDMEYYMPDVIIDADTAQTVKDLMKPFLDEHPVQKNVVSNYTDDERLAPIVTLATKEENGNMDKAVLCRYIGASVSRTYGDNVQKDNLKPLCLFAVAFIRTDANGNNSLVTFVPMGITMQEAESDTSKLMYDGEIAEYSLEPKDNDNDGFRYRITCSDAQDNVIGKYETNSKMGTIK